MHQSTHGCHYVSVVNKSTVHLVGRGTGRGSGSGRPIQTEWSVAHQGLGEFEQMVLLAILHLEGEVYGVPIVEEIEERTGRAVSRAAVYVTLRRLEKKGLLSSWMSDPTPERGGKPRRCVRVEPAGLRVLRESRRLMDLMWEGIDPALADMS